MSSSRKTFVARRFGLAVMLSAVGWSAIFLSTPHYRSDEDLYARKRMLFAPLGHTGLTEVLDALAQIRKMSVLWDISKQDRAGEKIVDKSFLELIESGAGFLTLAEMVVVYEMLFAMNFDGARQLAEVVLEKRPSSISTSLALGFMLERVYDQPRQAGEVFLNLMDHAKMPEWFRDLGNRMVAADPELKERRQSDFICELLAKVQSPAQYPRLVERCRGVSSSP